MLAVVGTRHATPQGKLFTKNLIAELAERHPDLVIVSGLAFGIDVTAHQAALDAGLRTIGVMATGFDQVYPAKHTKIASAMKEQGGLLTEHFRGDKLVPGCFVGRNRIMAGLCDAVLIAESPAKGGSLTTADMADSYNRQVFAVPGRPTDLKSAGCNDLIRRNVAAMVCSAEDVEFELGWNDGKTQVDQSSTFPELNLPDLTEEERRAMCAIRKCGKMDLTDLTLELDMTATQLATLIFGMEMRGLVHKLPGNMVMVGK